MNKTFKRLTHVAATGLLAGLLAVTTVSLAEAGGRHRHHGGGGGDALAAGVAGFLLGTLAAPRVYAPVYAAPPVVYVEPAPVYAYPEPVYVSPPVYPAPAPIYGGPVRRPYSDYGYNGGYGYDGGYDGPPRVVTYNESIADLDPWTPGWYDYCRSKYRSFDAKTGTFMGYDGQRHFCNVR